MSRSMSPAEAAEFGAANVLLEGMYVDDHLRVLLLAVADGSISVRQALELRQGAAS